MNFISWNTRRVLNESTSNYYHDELVEESISKTLKPVMNKMKKLNIGLPYRDARLFFFQFLKDKHPNLVPTGFETKKPSAKDVNAIVGQIAIESPELLDKFGEEFDAYSKEEASSGMDRVSQFLNVAATMRTGKGVRPSKAAAEREGGVRKDYSKLTAQEIANATTDAIKKKQDEFEAGDDVSDERLLIKLAASSVLSKLEQEDVNPEAIENVANAIAKIETITKFKKFLDYISNMEEYLVIHQYLEDTLDVIETNLEDMQTEKEEEEARGNINDEVRQDPREVDPIGDDIELAKIEAEDAESCPYSDEEIDAEKADLDGDGEVSDFDMEEAYNIGLRADSEEEAWDAFSDEFPMVIDIDRKWKLGDALRQGLTDNERLGSSNGISDEEIDAEKADLDDDGEVSEYERKRGEAIAKAMQRSGEKEEEEDEEVAMSPQAIQQHLINQYRQKMQNQYSHERRNRYGY
jgi:hypothetical protein